MELNAEQIKKALECCTRGRKSKEDRPCLDCPYNECNIVGGTGERQIKGTCQGWLMKDALALINELAVKTEAQYIGTYTDKSFVYVSAMFKLIDRVANEMLEGKDGT